MNNKNKWSLGAVMGVILLSPFIALIWLFDLIFKRKNGAKNDRRN